MSTEQSCPWCGSETYSTPGTNVLTTSSVCPTCKRDLSSLTGPVAGKIASTRKSIEENTIQLCINSGKISAIKYYRTEMNKLPGVNVSLKEAKETVESLLKSRNLVALVRPPGRNGYVIALFLLALIIASIIYFFTHR
ncbi:hypothetical protein SAMN05660909_00061 [Chitinophaga terrae (ex Kim and Jung 2007)]|uniref:Uncharacterized protein n=1 Tax=Chitinophaga terrae (ex Kim and Jung 2007) TaxID=408074 RepID=A0A1H3WVG2_9BACT|nr:hypothetical protein [Chitinophaga terrae (ex Kim and Jung 2007)]MDQ0107082.1 transposase-like protein [Chitinophaga terrae (ex Kim and Jung 2007)]GEP90328.1 hypothetical protein CTE07_19730 [Chitinophaga terrae (ex Kim and Jung 2007)]SDZ90354.1 hypothetical protein SAMN05660909_00061 [Chitinophaga terrae (ex Kim and Jung 2007)]